MYSFIYSWFTCPSGPRPRRKGKKERRSSCFQGSENAPFLFLEAFSPGGVFLKAVHFVFGGGVSLMDRCMNKKGLAILVGEGVKWVICPVGEWGDGWWEKEGRI